MVQFNLVKLLILLTILLILKADTPFKFSKKLEVNKSLELEVKLNKMPTND